MLAALGADAVGMSTACEAMVLNYMGIKVLGISCITDMAIDNEDLQVTHEEVQAVAAKASQDIIRLVGKTATVL
jgi:purine-nucleoside phosphorylase